MNNKNPKSKIKSLLIILCSLLVFSCNRDTSNQNAALPEKTVITSDIATELDTEVLKTIQSIIEENPSIDFTQVGLTGAPELMNVMPNSWWKLTRLTEAEKHVFLEKNTDAFMQIENLMRNEDMGWGWLDDNRYEYYSIFEQKVGSDTFYRVLVTSSNNPDFMSRSARFVQFLVYQDNILASGFYNSLYYTQTDVIGAFQSIDIIYYAEKIKGILVTRLQMAGVSDNNSNTWDVSAIRANGQITGFSQSQYYLMNDLLKGSFLPIEISASNCLVDPDIPLRYSLQNAFDGNSSTSYVVNTEDGDGLLEITITGTSNMRLSIKRIAIINSCAKNMLSSENKNRIKTVSLFSFADMDFHTVELTDDTLEWQIIESDEIGFSVAEVYSGARYHNTIVVGFNLYSEYYGWLFGDIDE